jgi:hypothetical protein
MNRVPMHMALKHKHLVLEQSKIDRARRLLRVPTEQEAIERALDLLLSEETIIRAHQKVKAVGGFEDPFRE